MDATDPVFLGLDVAGAAALSAMLVLFAFAVWFGLTRCNPGIGAEEQARRMDASRRS